MTSHVSWPSIALFHNAVHTLKLLQALGHPLPKIRYRAKVKLHGACMGVQRTATGVVPQSRSMTLIDVDKYGFAAWVRKNEPLFAMLPEGHTVFGEWCGPGVEPGVAASDLERKLFAVFAIQAGYGDDAMLIVEPDALSTYLPWATVLPWHGDEITIDYADEGALEPRVERLNAIVDEVEREDPFIKERFGISGVGEGLVFYPLEAARSPEPYAQLMFKAKGAKHRTVRAKAVALAPELVTSIDAFVDLVVTEARLRQGLSALGLEHAKPEPKVVIEEAPPESACASRARQARELLAEHKDASPIQAIKLLRERFGWSLVEAKEAAQNARSPTTHTLEERQGAFAKVAIAQFVAWVSDDVEKETHAERATAGLEWSQVQRAVSNRAREWLLGAN